jgi:hypothetical protein
MAGTFTPEEIDDRIYGSKIVVVSEQAMLNVIYVIKVCMLIMYTRLTLGLRAQKAVRYLAIYVFCGWLGTEVAFFTACRPFSGYWAMPPPDPQCTTLEHYAIIQGCFNITSDILMLFIPLPLVLKLHLPLKQKIILILIFSMGLFVIIAALLTKIFNLTDVWNPVYMQWYIRESSVAVFVSNLPMIWPLLREWFPCLRSLTTPATYPSEGLGKKSGYGTGPQSTASAAAGRALSTNYSRKVHSRNLASIGGDDIEMKGHPRHHGTRSDSTEDIMRPDSSEENGKSGGIHVTVERTVVMESRKADPELDVEKGLYDWDDMRSPRPTYDRRSKK